MTLTLEGVQTGMLIAAYALLVLIVFSANVSRITGKPNWRMLLPSIFWPISAVVVLVVVAIGVVESYISDMKWLMASYKNKRKGKA